MGRKRWKAGQPPERKDVERELEGHATDEERQRRGSTPTEDGVERALEVEPGVEWHSGEDAGDVPPTGGNPT